MPAGDIARRDPITSCPGFGLDCRPSLFSSSLIRRSSFNAAMPVKGLGVIGERLAALGETAAATPLVDGGSVGATVSVADTSDLLLFLGLCGLSKVSGAACGGPAWIWPIAIVFLSLSAIDHN